MSVLTSSLSEWLYCSLEVSLCGSEVMPVVTVIHDKGHPLASRMDGEDVAQLCGDMSKCTGQTMLT